MRFKSKPVLMRCGIDDLVDSALAFVDTLRPFIDLASMETVAMVKPNPCVMVADGKVWCFDFLGRLRQITEQDRPFVFSVKGVYYLP